MSTTLILPNDYVILSVFQFAGSSSEADYVSVVDQSISFTSVNRIQNLNVQILIVADDFTELLETFSAILSSVFVSREAGGAAIGLSDQERARLIQDPDAASVNILDDDGKCFSNTFY